MGVTVKSLESKALTAGNNVAYAPLAGKGAIVKSIVLVNTSSGASTITVEFQDGRSSTGNLRKISPAGVSIPQGGMLQLDAEITLSYVHATNGDKIIVTCNTGQVDCVISGIERDN